LDIVRQQSVQQQNMAALEALRAHAKHWRSTSLPPALIEAASLNGVSCATSIFLKFEIDFPGMPRLFGIMLTGAERFIQFEIETDVSHTKLELVDVWRDVTAQQNLSFHNPGVGIGAGALALQILRELKAEPGD